MVGWAVSKDPCMTDAPQPAAEDDRAERLLALSALDTEADPLFDALARSAAIATGVPIALITLVDNERQWFKANVGFAGTRETPRDVAFCAQTILGPELMEVTDAGSDPRWAENPLVTGYPGIRFYAGVPLTLHDGVRVGALCVLDRTPRKLDDGQRQALLALASAAVEALELRMRTLQRQAAQQRQRDDAVSGLEAAKAAATLVARTDRLMGAGRWSLDLDTRQVCWSDETCAVHDVPPGHRPTLIEAFNYYTPEARPKIESAVKTAMIDPQASWDLELPMLTAKGRPIWVRTIGFAQMQPAPARLVGVVQDITIRRRVVAALEASDRRFRKLFEFSLGLICTHDHEGMLLSVNPAAAASLGYSVGELLGRPLTDFIPAERHAAFGSYLLQLMTKDRHAGMLELIAKDGSRRVWQYQSVLDDQGDEPYVLGHALDITERYQQELRLWDEATRDPLTKCFNRRYLDNLSDAFAAEAWGCIAIDLDHFKQVNDQYGHQRGDEVLVAMARFLFRHARRDDPVVRLGGDEFLLLLRGADGEATARVARDIEADRASAPIGFTMGTASFGHGVSLAEGLGEADRRLYQRRAVDRAPAASATDPLS
jgi:diguanylate cyclase (GGDEF)-like protein/PAS domain S-box-containing protein